MTTITPLLTTHGYGLLMGRLHNRRTVGHAGGINGFRTNFIRFPEEKACVIVLCNSEESDFLGVTKALAAILFGEDYEMPPEKNTLKLDDSLLTSYAGLYEIVPGVTLEVERCNEQMHVTCGQAKSVFQPQSDILFSNEESETSLTFHRSGDGAVSHLTLSQPQTYSPQTKVEMEARRIRK